jgi:hypothetical protein
MQLREVSDLRAKSPVWIWFVRLGKGQWWPGAVECVALPDGVPSVTVRFEYISASRKNSHPVSSVGISTTRMRYLERRDVKIKGIDRPRYVPVPIIEKPEIPNGIAQRQPRSAEDVASSTVQRRAPHRQSDRVGNPAPGVSSLHSSPAHYLQRDPWSGR